MKRCLSIALILALLGTASAMPAVAEETEIVFEDAEATVDEVMMADGTDLTVIGTEMSPDLTLAELDGLLPNAGDAEDPAAQAPASDETDPAAETQLEQPAATSIIFSTKSLTIGVGEKYTGLTVTALPEGSALPKLKWRSSNTKIAKVNARTGRIVGVKKGTATIYAKISGGKKEISCKVTVKAKPKKVALKPKTLTLEIGDRSKLKVSFAKGYGSATRTFTSSNESVATVDAAGVVTAVSAGTATITVKTYNGKKAKCKVKVLDAPASIAFPDSILPLAIDQTAMLNATALSADGTVLPTAIEYAVDESSPDPGCIQLLDQAGMVTGLHEGQAVIRATTRNGVVARCVVDVQVLPEDVSLNLSAITIGVKEVYVGLIAQVTPPAGYTSCLQDVTWTTSNPGIATVDAKTGAITGVKRGNCTVTATTANGITASCKVKVLKAPTSSTITISPANGSLKVGQSGKYRITFTSGYGGSLSYESSETDVATVSNDGIVTAVAPGYCTITVTTYNGVVKTAKLQVLSDENTSDDPDNGNKSGDDEKIQYILRLAQTKLGRPYVYGSFGPNSFDCSGFVYWCFKQVNIKLKDSAYKQGYDERYPKISYSNLRPGDLVFFDTVSDSDLSDHAGIYMGNGKFIHASSSAGMVIISSLSSGYYQRQFSWGRRVL